MAEGFVLNIPQEMLNRLQKADEKIEKLDKNSRRVGENIRLAFMESAKGVDKFIGSLNSAQKILDGFKDKKINVGFNLDAKAVTDLKKQLENLGVNIPVGVTGTGGGSGSSGGNAGESQSLKNLLDGIVILTKSVENLTQKIDGIKVTGSGSTSGGSGSSNSGKQQTTKVDPIVNSQNAKSISERIQAIKLLQKEMFNLDTTDKNYQRTLNTLNAELTRQQNVLRQVGVEIGKIKTPKIEIPKPNFEPLRQQYRQNQSELKNLQSEYDNVVKKIKEAEAQMANIKAGKGGSYNPKEYQQNLGKAFNLEQEIKLYQDENKLISEKMRLLNQEYQAKVKVQQATDPKNLALIAKEKTEYEKLLKTISELEKVRAKADKSIGKYGINSQIGQQADKVYQQTEQALIRHNQRRIALEQQYGTELSNIKQQQNVKDLNDLIKQKDAELRAIEQAEQKALQQYTKLASERNRLLTEQYNNQKIIDNPKTDNATRQQAIQQQQLITAELQRNKQEMLNIEQQYQGKLAAVQQRAGQQELQRVRRQKQQEIDEIRRAERRRQDIQRRWDERRYSRPQGALQYSQNAKTINGQIKAIEYLKKAQKSLDVSTSQGKKQFNELEREIKRTENALRRYGVQLGGVREQSSHLFNISQQLGRALSLMFSVSQIGQYISKMVNIRKEMELQQRSLQVLLQSKDKANELWNQTLDLAVKSPFRVKELVTYTKQLAAYRIESDKLFETNKMLADVSAGLGVDMQRLILAFGQVKSASFLRGCLGKGTPIRLYNDDIKEVQNIVVGDVIMGDDDTPRNVKEVIYGKEQMYIVRQGAYGDDYRVNENHILTLKDKITDTIVDVYVKDYLKDEKRYNGVKISTDGNIIDYHIELIKDNVDEYFGFVIDGNKRFLLGDGTITHNTELRQFTEAGIPMLEELSKYFEELYGRSVSVAEVFDMISKRMVTFVDVENVFQRMTSAGGVFFNMQEELSQTTAGMISNLQDSIDLMFNEIGKRNQGVINTAIKWARGLVDNWETVGKVMKGTLVILASYKALTIDWGRTIGNISNKFKDLGTNILTNSKGNLIAGSVMIIVTALLAAARAYQKYRAGINEAIDAHAKFADSVNELSIDFNRLEIDKKSEDIEEYKDKLSQLVGIAQQQYNIEIDFVVNDLQSIDEVKRKFNELKEQIMSFNNFSLAFDIEFAEQERIGRGGGLGRGISRDIEKLSEAQKDLVPYFTDVNKILSSMMSTTHNLTEEQQKFVDAFKSQGETESAAAFFNRQKEGLELLSKEYDKFFKQYTSKDSDAKWYENAPAYAIRKIQEIYNIDYGSLSRDLGDYYKYLNKVAQEQENLFTNIAGNLETRIAEAKKSLGDQWTDEKSKKLAEDFILNAINAKATAEEWTEEIRYEFYKKANEVFGKKYEGFNIIPTLKTPDPIKLKEWQQKFNEEVEKAAKSISGKMKTEEYNYDLFSVFDINEDEQGLATTETKKLAELNQALDEAVKRREEILGKQKNKSPLFRQDELDDINLYIEKLTNLRDLLGGDDDKKKKGKNTAEERIKEQIRLIKELYQEYQKLSKEMGSTEAFDTVMSSYKGSIDNLFGSTLKVLKETPDSFDDWIKNVLAARESVVTTLEKDLGDNSKYLVGAGVNLTEEELKDFGITVEDLMKGISNEKAWEISYEKIKKHKQALNEVLETYSELELTDIQYNELFDIAWQGGADNVKKLLNIIEQGKDGLREYLESINGIDIVNKINGQWVQTNKKVEIDIDQQIEDFKNATTHAEKMAVALRYYLVTLKENPFGGDAKVTMQGMLDRAINRATSVVQGKSTQTIKFEDFIDFTNISGVVSFLETLRPEAEKAGEDAKIALEKAISETAVELTVMFHIQKQEEFENTIKEMFSNYEVSLELEKLDIPADWAKTFFGVETKSLDDIKDALEERKKEIKEANGDVSTELKKYDNRYLSEQEKKIQKALQIQVDGYKKEMAFIEDEERKITEMEAEQREERLKTYLEYARKAIGEKAKIKLEEYRKLQEIDETFVAKENATEEEKELFESTKKQAQAGVRREAREKQQKLEWEDFQKTDTFINIFDDLESASGDLLRHTLSKLNEFKDVWTDMPLEDMEKVVDAINKIENALAKIKPVKAKNAAKDTIEDIMKDFTYTDEKGKERKFEGNRRQFEKVVEAELAKNEEEMAKTQEDIATLEATMRLLQENNFEAVELMYKRDNAKGIKDVIKLIEQNADNKEIKKYIKDNNLNAFEGIFEEYQKQMRKESKGKDFSTEELQTLLAELGTEVSQEVKDLLQDIIEYKGGGADIGGFLQTNQIDFNFEAKVEGIDPRENIDKFVEYLTEIEKGNADIAENILQESLTNYKDFLKRFVTAIETNKENLEKVNIKNLPDFDRLTEYDKKFFDNILAKMKGKNGKKKTLEEKDLVKIEEETIEYVNKVNDSLDSIKRYLLLVASGDTEGAEEYYKANEDKLSGYDKVLKKFVKAFENAIPNLQKVREKIPKKVDKNTEFVLNEFLTYLDGIKNVDEVKNYDTDNIQNESDKLLIKELINYIVDASESKEVDEKYNKYKSLFQTLNNEIQKLKSDTSVKLNDKDTDKIEEEIKTFLKTLSQKELISEVNIALGDQDNQEEGSQEGQGELTTQLANVNEETEDEATAQQKITKEVEKQLKTQKKKLKQQEKENKKLKDAKNANNTIRTSNEEILDRMIDISKAVDTVTEGLDSVIEVMKALGKETDAFEMINGIASEVANSVTSMLSFQKEIRVASQGAEGFGKALNTAMGIIGWIVMAVQLISKIFTMVLEYQDKQIVKDIEAIAKEIENLEKKYEKLSESIEEGFAESSIVSAYNEANKTLDEMLVKQQKMIDLNDSRKQTEDVKKEREEMEKEMEEMYEKQEELREQYFSKITGGAFDSVLDAAGEFVDAWLEAFKETGDGLSGLEENFDEMFGQIVKQQASMLISDQFMKEWQDRLRQLSEGGLTTDEIKDWSNLVENDFPALNDALKTFYSNFEGFMDETNSLSGLQRGITQIQESTAQELASYLNSIRYIVSDNNATLKALLSAQTSSSASNPIVAQLQVIAQQTNAINTLLDTLVKGGHNLGGNGLKVFI